MEAYLGGDLLLGLAAFRASLRDENLSLLLICPWEGTAAKRLYAQQMTYLGGSHCEYVSGSQRSRILRLEIIWGAGW
jgi:hypothetical protein